MCLQIILTIITSSLEPAPFLHTPELTPSKHLRPSTLILVFEIRSPRWERNRGPYEREDLSELTEPSVTGATYLGVPPTGGFDNALITRYGQSQYHRQKAGGVSELLGVQQLARGPYTAELAPFGIAPIRGRGRDEGFARRSGRSLSPPKSPR
jgi:hypothetical protein